MERFLKHQQRKKDVTESYQVRLWSLKVLALRALHHRNHSSANPQPQTTFCYHQSSEAIIEPSYGRHCLKTTQVHPPL